MENQICNTEEKEWNESISKYLHKMKVRLDVILLCVFGVFAIVGCHIYMLYGWEYALEQMAVLSIILLPVTLGLVYSLVRGNLAGCYRQYRCKECGHTHRPKLEDLDNNISYQYCAKCNKKTKHEKVPMKK